MKMARVSRGQDTLSLSPDMRVAEVIDRWPQTLKTFIRMGFAPLANPVLRRTLARTVTIRQAASLRNVDLNILMANLQTAIANPTGHDEAFVDPDRLRYNEDTLPDLDGDINVAALVPCPVRTVLVEQFEAFLQRELVPKGVRTAWWFAAESLGFSDVKQFVTAAVRSGRLEGFPDFLVGVGSELFLHEEYGRRLYQDGFFMRQPPFELSRPEFSALEDPGGILQLQFVVLFSFGCDLSALGRCAVPESWFDLTEPRYAGKIVLPSLNLPVMGDFLAALYYHLGDALFIRFCRNVAGAASPARSARRQGQTAGAVFITPLHFSRITKGPDHRHVLPVDGFVAVPCWFVEREHRSDAAPVMREYLRSRELLDLYYRNGTFIPNRRDIPVEWPLNRLITRPWSSLLETIPDRLHEQLLRYFSLEVR